jgi:hypothetical protein
LGWGCSSVVKCLPSMHKALGCISSTEEKKRFNHSYLYGAFTVGLVKNDS